MQKQKSMTHATLTKKQFSKISNTFQYTM